MSPRYAYFYLMQDDPDRVGATVPRHVAHWHELQLPDYLGGPFADRTGGLITFQADDDQQAQHAVDADPFVREGAPEGPLAQAVEPPVRQPGGPLQLQAGW